MGAAGAALGISPVGKSFARKSGAATGWQSKSETVSDSKKGNLRKGSKGFKKAQCFYFLVFLATKKEPLGISAKRLIGST